MGRIRFNIFQMRKNRGSVEKFHGAVIDHVGHQNTRVFREVTEVGEMLEKLPDVIGTTTPQRSSDHFRLGKSLVARRRERARERQKISRNLHRVLSLLLADGNFG